MFEQFLSARIFKEAWEKKSELYGCFQALEAFGEQEH